MSRRALAALFCAAFALTPGVARARGAATLEGGTIVFFADTLTLIASLWYALRILCRRLQSASRLQAGQTHQEAY